MRYFYVKTSIKAMYHCGYILKYNIDILLCIRTFIYKVLISLTSTKSTYVSHVKRYAIVRFVYALWTEDFGTTQLCLNYSKSLFIL